MWFLRNGLRRAVDQEERVMAPLSTTTVITSNGCFFENLIKKGDGE